VTVVLRLREGTTRELAIDDWCAPASATERDLCVDLVGPVLDLGCGPGRMVVSLSTRGVPALGIDASPNAVRWASANGAPVLLHSIFDPLPGEGRWASVLLLDGNIGIGGDPVALLARVRELLHVHGTAVVEVDPPGSLSASTTARLERDGERTGWFPWALVAADRVDALAERAGLRADSVRAMGGRWFATLRLDRSAQ